MRKQETCEIVHRKAQLIAVLAGLPRRPLVLRTDAGIADEHVEPPVIGEHGLGKLSRLGERRQVGLIEGRFSAAGPLDLIDERFGARRIAAMDQDLGAGGGKPCGDIAADAVGRAGDQYRLAIHLHLACPLFVLLALVPAWQESCDR